MNPRSNTVPKALAFLALVGLTVWVVVATEGDGKARLEAFSRKPDRVMGTSCRLVAVVKPGGEQTARIALTAAEKALRAVEAAMSVHLDSSPLSRFNQAPTGLKVAVPPPVVEVVRLARAIHRQSGGAFDITCRPLIGLWKRCGKAGKLPTREEIERARSASSMALLGEGQGGLVRRGPGVQVDLGGIAKGWGIDRALAAIREAGCRGGLVDVGGDLAVFGRPSRGRSWPVAIRSPFGPGTVRTIHLTDGAVCTSGNYHRYVTIQGRRYSHILDPRSGRPADASPSVTVVAPTAAVADGWATALSVLGPAGLNRLPRTPGVEALLVTGTAGAHREVTTPGFPPGVGSR